MQKTHMCQELLLLLNNSNMHGFHYQSLYQTHFLYFNVCEKKQAPEADARWTAARPKKPHRRLGLLLPPRRCRKLVLLLLFLLLLLMASTAMVSRSLQIPW